MEKRIMQAVCDRFGLPHEEPADVSRVDLEITSDEKAKIMNPSARDWGSLPPCIGADISCLSPLDAKKLFLDRFYELVV